MSTKLVTKSITAENQFTDAVSLKKDQVAGVSIDMGTLASSSIVVQRRLPGHSVWDTVGRYEGDLGFTVSEGFDIKAQFPQDIRVGCATGSFGSGTGTVAIATGE